MELPDIEIRNATDNAYGIFEFKDYKEYSEAEAKCLVLTFGIPVYISKDDAKRIIESLKTAYNL